MEKGNGAAGGSPAGAAGGRPGGEMTDQGGQAAASSGGASQVAGATDKPQSPMSGEIEFEDGSRYGLGEDGQWRMTDSSGRTSVWDSGTGIWRDPATGEPMPSDFQQAFGFDANNPGHWQDYAGRYQTLARRAREAGDTKTADAWQAWYDHAVKQSQRLTGIGGS
jgi:hypothetical protein